MYSVFKNMYSSQELFNSPMKHASVTVFLSNPPLPLFLLSLLPPLLPCLFLLCPLTQLLLPPAVLNLLLVRHEFLSYLQTTALTFKLTLLVCSFVSWFVYWKIWMDCNFFLKFLNQRGLGCASVSFWIIVGTFMRVIFVFLSAIIKYAQDLVYCVCLHQGLLPWCDCGLCWENVLFFQM